MARDFEASSKKYDDMKPIIRQISQQTTIIRTNCLPFRCDR